MVDYVADFTLEEQPEVEADFSIEVSNTDHNTLLNRDLPNQHSMDAITGLVSALGGKQDVLTAGEGISIENGVISATVQSAVWGNITGTLSDQTDLQNALNGKLDNSALDGYATENWVTNQGYLTQIVSADVTSALGYTPYNSTNPSGYQTASDVANAVATETSARELADNGLQAQIDAIVSSSDVFDIVGTYAELQAYDISTVPVNDIIKVLVDSTHDNAATYYRCVETGGVKSWSYIGSEGAYYTKSESDNKFVPQTRTVNGKALSSDITLTASDVGALPSSTTIGDGTLTIQVNSTDLQTFTANQSGNVTANIVVPTDTGDLTNTAGFITSSALANYVQNTATSSNSVTLFGTANTTSYYVNSINIGFQSVVNGGNGTAVGYNSQAVYYGAALGSGTSASGQAAVAIGYGAIASGISSIQIGYGINAEKNTLYVGFYNSGSNINYKLLGSDGKVPDVRLPIATSVSSASTNADVVGAKLFYDTCGDIETLINAL